MHSITRGPSGRFFHGLLLLGCCATSVHAGGTSENALLIVDPLNAESLYVAHYYQHARGIPDANVVYMNPSPGSYTQFAGATLEAFFGALDNQDIADHIDYVVLPSGGSFFMSAPGLVTDGCSPVTRFSTTGAYTLANLKTMILAGTTSGLGNGYYRGADDARAFDSNTAWSGGLPNANGKRYFIGAQLGYTGPLGNTLSEVLAMIDRSVAVDGTHPSGTIYYMQTNDFLRSGPRHGAYPAAVTSITSLGGSAQHLFADLPLGHPDCLGIMTGLADPDITSANFTILPGAFCDHLTASAATFDVASQTKMSRWIARGASGTSGAVEEPCAYAGKFPHARLHFFYEKGLSLGEAFLRSHGFAPFQTLLLGDPLTRPFTHIPSVILAGIPAGAASNTIALTPSATTTHPTAQVQSFDLLVDGRLTGHVLNGASFALETSAFTDGWHELRCLAYDNTPVRSVGRSIDSIVIDNHGRSCTLGVSPAIGDLTRRFDFTASGTGGTVQELRLVQGSRVIAASASSPSLSSVFGRTLGAGITRVQCEALFSDGTIARSPPVDVDVAFSAGAPAQAPPIAFNYTKHVRNDRVALVELPATFDEDFTTQTWTVTTTPSQAAITGGGNGPYRMLSPNIGASGSDTLSFQVTTPWGVSASATVTLVYDVPATCPAPSTYCIASPNSVGPGAVMSWSGSTSIGDNNLAISTDGLPVNTTGIYVCGQNSTQVPFGNGFLCIDSPFRRIGVVQADLFGETSRTIDFTHPPFDAGPFQFTSGSVWNFQLWYRNVAGGGAGFNLSNGLRVTFCP